MSQKRNALGSSPFDPLDVVVPSHEPTLAEAPALNKPATPANGRAAMTPTRAVRATFHIPEDLLEACRDAVVAFSGPPARLTLAAFATRALAAELERVTHELNDGNPIPPRNSAIRGGRPVT